MEAFPAESADHTPTLAEDPALGLDPRAKFGILLAVLLALFLGALDQTIVGTALPTHRHPARRQRLLHLGGHDLPAHVHDHRPVLRQAVRPVRSQADADDRHRDLPDRLGAVRPVARTWPSSSCSAASRASAPARCSRSRSRSSATCSRRQERGKYQGLFGAVFGIAFLIGPALGGFLTDNCRLALDLLRQHPDRARQPLRDLARSCRRSSAPDASRNLDFLGGGVFTVAIGALLVGLTNKQTSDWATPQVGGCIAVGLVLIAALRARRVAGEGADRPAGPVPRPDVLGLDRLDVLRELRVLRRRSSSCRAGSRSSGARAPRSPATRHSRCWSA